MFKKFFIKQINDIKIFGLKLGSTLTLLHQHILTTRYKVCLTCQIYLLVTLNTKKLMQLIDNNVLREQMGANAQKYILEHHDWEKISKKAAIEINKFINS